MFVFFVFILYIVLFFALGLIVVSVNAINHNCEEGGDGGRGGDEGRRMHLKLGVTTVVYLLADCRSRLTCLLVYACIGKILMH